MRRTPLLTISLLSTCAGLLMLASGCNDDGRTLRPARPDQDSSVSVAATASTAVDLFDTTTVPPLLSITAPWRDGALIDTRHTCAGANVSPALSWSPAPLDTAEIAITLVDDEAPDFVHWVIAGISPAATSIAEAEVPEGAFAATNSSGTVGYTGPCPPVDATRTYRFTVHYLDQQLDLGDGVAGMDLMLAINGASIGEAEVTGTFSRP